ncbi:MAG: malto-oligosyltrehalose synthase [Chloroflexi bacterium]|nr:malto-oligosyltrehalose synthase [Chloroflexota bacterium]
MKRRLRLLHQASDPFREALDQALRQFQGTPGDRASFDRLDALIERQAYRLAFWRVAAEEINYRRFFDITELAAVRMEDPRVFAETHHLLLRLIGEGKIDGLRIDHPDGLRDPREYFLRLQRSCFVRYYAHHLVEPARRELDLDEDQLGQRLSLLFDRQVERDPDGAAARPFYIVVEKILSGDETLPRAWTVHGTTGYDFLNVLNGLFVERENERFFDNVYTRFTRSTTSLHDLANSTKKMVMLISLASEVNELAFRLKRIASHDRRHRDFTLNLLAFAIREVIAALRVYRTYIDPETGQATEADVARIDQAVAEAKRRNPRTDPSIFDFVRDTLLRRDAEAIDQERHHDLVQFVAHFQQATGPVMAKGVEDTAFYQYNRLVSLNEVGGEPDRFGVSPQAFHRHNQRQARLWPATMLSTSTQDTKRSEDVRARIDVLSELPRDWNAALTRWSRLNAPRKRTVDGRQAPDRNEEYLLYQTLLGAWPFGEMDAETYATFKERIAEFLLKALKEAKVHTSWINPNAAYEEAARAFVMAVLDESRSGPFLDDLRRLREQVAHYGAFSSLSQVVLKLAAPGVPDTYQGNEIWDFSLVDPDNRRPVDYALRQHLLDRLESDRARAGADWHAFVDDLLAHKEDGRIKLHVTRTLLGLRQERPSLFVGGRYQALRTAGSRRRHLVAFARHTDGDLAIVAAPVLVARLSRYRLVAPVGTEVWDDTVLYLPGGAGTVYRNLFTNERVVARSVEDGAGVPVADLLAAFPVAVLVRDQGTV